MDCSPPCGRPQITNLSLADGVIVSICNLPLVPSWVLAVLIGVLFGYKYLSLGPGVTGSLSYAITYFMFAVMMSSGLVVHSLFLNNCTGESGDNMFKYAAIVDVSLTSCIAFSFAFDGLVDLKWIPERSYYTWGAELTLYGLVFFAYITQYGSRMNLYTNSILVGCSLYMLSQLFLFSTKCPDVVELVYLIVAGLVGGVSMFLFKAKYCWLCDTLGPWSVEGIWYYSSGVSMLFLGLYILRTRKSECQIAYHNITIHMP